MMFFVVTLALLATATRAQARFPTIPKLTNFQFHPLSSPSPDYYAALASYPQQTFSAAPLMMPSVSRQRYTLPAELFGSMLEQSHGAYMSIPLQYAAAEHQPIAISIPMKANAPRKFRKVRLDTVKEEVVYGSPGATPLERSRRVRVNAPTTNYQFATDSNLQSASNVQGPIALVVQSNQPGRTGRFQRVNAEPAWKLLETAQSERFPQRPRGLVVSQHNVQLSPSASEQEAHARAAQPSLSRPSSYSRLTHPSEADTIVGRPYAKAGIHQIDPPRLEGTRPAHIPAPTPEARRPTVEHPAFVTENTRATDSFRPLTTPRKYTSRPTEALDYGTDIITIYDVDRNKNKKATTASGDSILKAVTSTLKVKSGNKATHKKGKVFDDVIYDYPGEDQVPFQSQRSHVKVKSPQSGVRASTTPLYSDHDDK